MSTRSLVWAVMGVSLLCGCHSYNRREPRSTATVTIKDVIIDQVDETAGTISVTFGKKDNSTKLVNVPLAEGVRVRVSHVCPGSVNNLPFRWEYVKYLWERGESVSIRLDVASTGLAVTSMASAND